MEDTICLCICVDVVESNVPRSGRLRRRSCKRHHLPGQSPPSRRSPPLHTASHHLCTRLCVANDTASRTSSPLLRFSTLPLRGRMDGWTQMTSSRRCQVHPPIQSPSARTLSRRRENSVSTKWTGLCPGGLLRKVPAVRFDYDPPGSWRKSRPPGSWRRTSALYYVEAGSRR